MERLPYQVVLCSDLPLLFEVIAKQGVEQSSDRTSKGIVAVTRSRQREAQSVSTWDELPFVDGEVPGLEEASQPRVRKSQRQRRQDRVRGTEILEPVP